MGITIRYTVGGRSVSRQQFLSGIEGQIRQFAIDEVTKRVRQSRCPVHGDAASIAEVRDTSGGLEFSLEGCCDKGVEAAQRAIS
jgi:hypothetical protein